MTRVVPPVLDALPGTPGHLPAYQSGRAVAKSGSASHAAGHAYRPADQASKEKW